MRHLKLEDYLYILIKGTVSTFETLFTSIED